jgi:hypothetical protein
MPRRMTTAMRQRRLLPSLSELIDPLPVGTAPYTHLALQALTAFSP